MKQKIWFFTNKTPEVVTQIECLVRRKLALYPLVDKAGFFYRLYHVPTNALIGIFGDRESGLKAFRELDSLSNWDFVDLKSKNRIPAPILREARRIVDKYHLKDDEMIDELAQYKALATQFRRRRRKGKYIPPKLWRLIERDYPEMLHGNH